MRNIFHSNGPIDLKQVESILRDWLSAYDKPLKKVLIIPPDGTRAHSMAGPITNLLYHLLPDSDVRILPALGTHFPMTTEEKQKIFGSEIPSYVYLDHDWRGGVESLGEISAGLISQMSEGLVSFPISVEVNRELLDGDYDLILSVGQVVPHEVVGMANYTKNIVVGCGGKDIIDKSHYLGAVYGMEHLMGRDYSPVRQVFDYAQQEYLSRLPIAYILTVTKTLAGSTTLEGLYVGNKREVFDQAVAKSQECNLDLLKKPLQKVVVYLEPKEFRSTWLGNKAIYRTRMAIANGGELLILASGVKSFGEDSEIDGLIRKYGYYGRDFVLENVEQKADLGKNLSVAAHLIHGSSEGRFQITYATEHLTKDEIIGVGFSHISYSEAITIYNPEVLQDGYNMVEGEEIFFVSNPALGLWALEDDFKSS